MQVCGRCMDHSISITTDWENRHRNFKHHLDNPCPWKCCISTVTSEVDIFLGSFTPSSLVLFSQIFCTSGNKYPSSMRDHNNLQHNLIAFISVSGRYLISYLISLWNSSCLAWGNIGRLLFNTYPHDRQFLAQHEKVKMGKKIIFVNLLLCYRIASEWQPPA